MHHTLRRIAVRAVSHLPFEHSLRKLYGRLSNDQSSRYDRQTFEVMNRVLNVDSNCIDVGCYRGEILSEILRISPKGRHFAFEPNPENFNYLEKRFGRKVMHHLALSDEVGEVTFHNVVGRSARSGLKRVEYPDSNQRVEEITVPCERLDNVIPDDVEIDFLKIDVEGAELGVLRGAMELLKRSRPVVVFEHDRETARFFETRPEQIFDLFTEVGLEVSLLDRWLTQRAGLSREDFVDCFDERSEFYFIAYSGH